MKKSFLLTIVVLLLCPLAAFADAKDTYEQAQELLAQSQYSEAAKLFDSISTYEDSSMLAMYCKACALCESGYYDMGIDSFTLLGDFKDSAMRINYYTARNLEDNAGKNWPLLQQAQNIYFSIPVFLDSFDRFLALNEKIASAKETQLQTAQIGDSIHFGAYEQDSNGLNGTEAIEWLVLDQQDNRLLVISKYALDTQPYSNDRTSTAWSTSNMRSWLNNDFLRAAFSVDEQTMIPTVTLTTEKDSRPNTVSDSPTLDKVFLLSVAEVNQYLPSPASRVCFPVYQASLERKWDSSRRDTILGSEFWWLRSAGSTSKEPYAVGIDRSGAIEDNHFASVYQLGHVRPAMWITVE